MRQERRQGGGVCRRERREHDEDHEHHERAGEHELHRAAQAQPDRVGDERRQQEHAADHVHLRLRPAEHRDDVLRTDRAPRPVPRRTRRRRTSSRSPGRTSARVRAARRSRHPRSPGAGSRERRRSRPAGPTPRAPRPTASSDAGPAARTASVGSSRIPVPSTAATYRADPSSSPIRPGLDRSVSWAYGGGGHASSIDRTASGRQMADSPRSSIFRQRLAGGPAAGPRPVTSSLGSSCHDDAMRVATSENLPLMGRHASPAPEPEPAAEPVTTSRRRHDLGRARPARARRGRGHPRRAALGGHAVDVRDLDRGRRRGPRARGRLAGRRPSRATSTIVPSRRDGCAIGR